MAMKYSKLGWIDPLRKHQQMTPMMVLDAHSSHTRAMYTVSVLARRHDLSVCFPAAKNVYSVQPSDRPQMMLEISMSPWLALSST